MKHKFVRAAHDELKQSIKWYNQECPGLGYEFSDEVNRSIERIKENPQAWQRLSKQTRRCLARRFPYGIVYYVDNQEILILAIQHLNREPGIWLDRIPKHD